MNDSRADRSSRPEVFCKKDVLRNFAKFAERHLCQRLFFNRLVSFRLATSLKKSLWHKCFPVNSTKFLRTPFFYRAPRLAALEQSNLCENDAEDLSRLSKVAC